MPPLTIPEGGTNATTIIGALAELNVPMGTVETISVGPGLTGGGSQESVVGISIQLVGTNQGGTGANNIAAARSNLQVWANPVFTGTARAPTAASNATGTELVNAEWVIAHTGTLTIDRITGGSF